MRKLSQTEELVKILAGRARRHTLTPEQISRAMDEQEYDVSGLDALYAALEALGIRVTEEEADMPMLDETQIGELEHELSAEGVALGAAADNGTGAGACPGRAGRGCGCPAETERSQPAAGGLGGQAVCRAGAALP